MNDDAAASVSRAPVELIVRRNSWPILLAPAFVLLALIAFIARMHHQLHLMAWGYFTFIGFVATSMAWKHFGALAATARANVHVDAAGVFADGKRLISPTEMKGPAYLRPRHDGTLLVYFPARHFWKSFGLEVADEAQGAELLERLGQDQARAAIQFRLASGFENRRLRSLATIVLVSSQSFFWLGSANPLMPIFFVAFAVAGLSFLIPTHVTIGADGILLERRGTRRFVRFGELLKIEEHVEYKDAVVLTLADFSQITMRTSVQDRPNFKGTVSDQTRALRKRLEVGLVAFRSRAARSDVLLALGRANRSAHEWITSLAKTTSASGYRVAPVTHEQLWAVLEDPAAERDDRAAALIALRAALDEKGKARVRKTIDACAEPRLRVALDAAIVEDESKLEEALEALDEASGRSN